MGLGHIGDSQGISFSCANIASAAALFDTHSDVISLYSLSKRKNDPRPNNEYSKKNP
jgi:hypothetical protein